MPNTPSTAAPRYGALGAATHALLRIGAGLLFMQHGAQKMLGWFGGMDGNGATAELFTRTGLAGVLELVGGLMIVAGFLTLPVAVILVLEMLAAYAIAHMPRGAVPLRNGGELALLYALVFAFLAGNGPGAWSVDGWLRRRAGR